MTKPLTITQSNQALCEELRSARQHFTEPYPALRGSKMHRPNISKVYIRDQHISYGVFLSHGGTPKSSMFDSCLLWIFREINHQLRTSIYGHHMFLSRFFPVLDRSILGCPQVPGAGTTSLSQVPSWIILLQISQLHTYQVRAQKHIKQCCWQSVREHPRHWVA